MAYIFPPIAYILHMLFPCPTFFKRSCFPNLSKEVFLSYVFSGWFLLSSLTIGHTCHSTSCSSLKLVNLNIIKSMQNHTYYSLKVFSCSPINLEHNSPFYFLYCPIIYLIFSSSMTWNKTAYIITLSFFMLFA